MWLNCVGADHNRRFNISWFLGAFQIYRRLLSEVLLASFFLQVFALVTPVFFQVIIDKVLVHRGISTLEVLVLGMVTISVFEASSGRSEPISSPTPPTASTPNWAGGYSAIWWPCRSPISRRAALPSDGWASDNP